MNMKNKRKGRSEDKFTLKHSMTLLSKNDKTFRLTSKCCIICCINFTTQKEYLDHIKNHIKQASRSSFNKTLWVLELKSNFHMEIIEKKNRDNDLEIELDAISEEIVVLRVFMYCSNATIMLLDNEKWPKQLTRCESVAFSINRTLFTQVPFKYQIFIHYSRNGVIYLENFELQVNNIKTKRMGFLKLGRLQEFLPLESTKNLFKNNFEIFNGIKQNELVLFNFLGEIQRKSKFDKLDEDNYEYLLSRLVEIEELECAKALGMYNKENQKVEVAYGRYSLKVENLSDNRPSVLVYDNVIITPKPEENAHPRQRQRPIRGMIVDTKIDRVIIEFDKQVNVNKLYKVQFMINRMTFRLERNALLLSNKKHLSNLLFPKNYKPSLLHIDNESFQYFNKSIKTNMEQQIAVKNVFYGIAHPLPYIIFGPPGTGKTTTVVECVLQIWSKKPDANILIAASSNSACNEVATRLMNFIPNSDILRLFAKSQEKCIDKIDEDLIETSNLDERYHYYPPIEEIYQYRIVLATLSTTGKLVQGYCRSTHFTHLFIDECGSSTEASALIPISGLISGDSKFTGNIILSGDPLQLGPVTQSKMAESLGYGTSLLERLTNLGVYKKNNETKQYNNNIIIKLKQNFRSHPSLLYLSNTMFYENELIPMAPAALVNWAIGWKYLINHKFPMFFKSVLGRAQRDPRSPSWFNLKEIDSVIKYVGYLVNKTINNKHITEADIGIISPYRKQCQKIREHCNKNKWNNIEIASVESFQGCEKSVIILSTVRARSKSIGFLDNPKRLNVALTRAKGLLIIIGDPNVLKLDEHWRKVIEYCADNRAITGEPFRL